MNPEVMFSRKSDEWATPDDLFVALDREFGFTFDAAATRQNAKKPDYFGIDDLGGIYPTNHGDALEADWRAAHVYWCNPPYSQCRAFVAKAAEARRAGALSVLLVPSRTDTRWFHDHAWDRHTNRARPGVEIRFFKGRLRFGDGKNCAPFPSMLLIFRPDHVPSPVTLTEEDAARLAPVLHNAIAEVDASVDGGTIVPDDGFALMTAYDWARGLLRRIGAKGTP